MSPGKRRPTREILIELAVQYGEAGKRLAQALGRSEAVVDTWERLCNVPRLVGYVREARRAPSGTVVFVGSSSVVRFPLEQLFPGAPALNRGLHAERLADTMRRLRWTLPVARPSGVIVWAGADDLRALAADPLVIVERLARLLDAIDVQLPGVSITLLGALPWCDQTATALDRLRRLNEGLRALAFARGIAFVGVDRPPLTNAGGGLAPELADRDRKHLGFAGYEQLARWIVEEGGEAAAALAPSPTPPRRTPASRSAR
jgi:lysophospholipase L1-like esterase